MDDARRGDGAAGGADAAAGPQAPAVAQHPGLAHYEAAVKLYEKADYDGAILEFKAALNLLPTLVPAWVNLGNCYDKQKFYGIAANYFEIAMALEPTLGEAYNNLATMFHKMDFMAAARAVTEHAIQLMPHDERIRWNRSVFNLATGLLSVGWEDYDSRFTRPGATDSQRYAPPAYWNGESLEGRSIRVWTEQGYGEIILYLSMLPDLMAKARPAKVIIETQARIVPVIQRAFPQCEVMAYGERPKVTDFQIAAGSLGKLYRRRTNSFPMHYGYMKSEPKLRHAVRKTLLGVAEGKRIIGVSWRSNNTMLGDGKSVPLEALDPILSKDYCFLSLQYGECGQELNAASERGRHLHVAEECGADLEQFYALVDACDLVITVSNTTAHVAGSLNVPCWVMLPRGEFRLWHWFLLRTDSPWYPSLKLFRQMSVPNPRTDWWPEVVKMVEGALF
jgi:hypothetical protein